MDKPRVIRDFEKLPLEIQEMIKLTYPYGFKNHLIGFFNKEGKHVSALPFETDEKYYLVRMTPVEAKALVAGDDDYDDDGVLKGSVLEDYQEKYGDDEEIPLEGDPVEEDEDDES
jgi:hypothetical protein